MVETLCGSLWKLVSCAPSSTFRWLLTNGFASKNCCSRGAIGTGRRRRCRQGQRGHRGQPDMGPRAATTRRRPGTAGFWRSHLSLSKRLRATAAPAGAGGEPGAAANGLTEPPLAPAPHGTLHSAVANDVAATSDAVSVTAEGGLPWLLHPMPVATWRDERGRPDPHISGDTTPPITTRCSPPSIW